MLEMLHKIANNGLEFLKGFNPPRKVKQAQVHAFKPMRIEEFINQKPHPIWFLRRYEKRIIEFSVGFGLALTVLVLIIKNV